MLGMETGRGRCWNRKRMQEVELFLRTMDRRGGDVWWLRAVKVNARHCISWSNSIQKIPNLPGN